MTEHDAEPQVHWSPDAPVNMTTSPLHTNVPGDVTCSTCMVAAGTKPWEPFRLPMPEAFVRMDFTEDEKATLMGTPVETVEAPLTVAIPVSRQMAVDMGLEAPTPKEAAERAASHLAFLRRCVLAWPAWQAVDVLVRMAGERDPIAKMVLDLHKRVESGGPVCNGCEFEGHDAESPEWPCATVGMIVTYYFGVGVFPDLDYASARRYGQPAPVALTLEEG